MTEQSDPNILEVVIEYDGTACRVVPGEMDVAEQNKVRFRNQTSGKVFLSFSEESLFPTSKTSLDPEQHTDLIANKVQRGIYPYAVFCEVTSDFATASSMPIIIVRR
jgi:hypothetical protein